MSTHKNRRLSAEQQQRVYHDWLMPTYPALFNAEFLPMPIGIFQQLSLCLPEHISKIDLRTALGWYASRLKYLNNLCSHDHRYHLDGSVGSVISPEEKAAAVQKIAEITKRKRKSTVKTPKVAA